MLSNLMSNWGTFIAVVITLAISIAMFIYSLHKLELPDDND